jgi:hypothetical protein
MTFTPDQKKAIDSQLTENRYDIRQELNSVEDGSDKWWSLKSSETNLTSLLMFGSYEEKNEVAQIVRLRN